MSPRSLLRSLSMLASLAAVAVPGAAQSGKPPAAGSPDTVALEGTMKLFYRAANEIVVVTIDGVEHIYRFTRDLVVHGGKAPGVDALEGLREGTTIVVHYNAAGPEPTVREVDVVGDEMRITEGVATRVDRRRDRITIRYDSGKTETFVLTKLAAAEEPREIAAMAKVMIYYTDEHGRKVVHYCRVVPESGVPQR